MATQNHLNRVYLSKKPSLFQAISRQLSAISLGQQSPKYKAPEKLSSDPSGQILICDNLRKSAVKSPTIVRDGASFVCRPLPTNKNRNSLRSLRLCGDFLNELAVRRYALGALLFAITHLRLMYFLRTWRPLRLRASNLFPSICG